MEKGLNMPANGYNTALWIFYIPFVLVEVPSNMIMSLPRVRPNIFLGLNMLVLGIVATCQGLTASYAGLLVCRFLMGIYEATLPAGDKHCEKKRLDPYTSRCRVTRGRVLHSQAGLSPLCHVLHLWCLGPVLQRSAGIRDP
jgi:hypothetical protein